jgi:hypothetical protein
VVAARNSRYQQLLWLYCFLFAALTGLLGHAAATGFLVAIASSDKFAAHTTWLLQKSTDGSISPLSKLLFWPYHLGLRGKLYIQVGSSSASRSQRLSISQAAVWAAGCLLVLQHPVC